MPPQGITITDPITIEMVMAWTTLLAPYLSIPLLIWAGYNIAVFIAEKVRDLAHDAQKAGEETRYRETHPDPDQ
jgi:hypothetical protein